MSETVKVAGLTVTINDIGLVEIQTRQDNRDVLDREEVWELVNVLIEMVDPPITIQS